MGEAAGAGVALGAASPAFRWAVLGLLPASQASRVTQTAWDFLSLGEKGK